MPVTLILFAILVAPQLGDWISSYLASKIPGAHEANPIMVWLMKRLGFNGAFAIEKSIVVASGYFLTLLLGTVGAIMLAVLDLVYSYTVWNNLRIAKVI